VYSSEQLRVVAASIYASEYTATDYTATEYTATILLHYYRQQLLPPRWLTMKLEYFAEEDGGGTPTVLYQAALSADVPAVKVEDTEDAVGACDSPEEEEEGTQFVKVEGAEDAGACNSPEEEKLGDIRMQTAKPQR
jgi:hypothetical protein